MIPFPDRKYSIILADCPWPYDNPQDDNAARGGKPYAEMTIAELCDLPVQKIAAWNSILFLWATLPKLPEALFVMKAWGFTYTTCAFTWVKTNPVSGTIFSGLGYWTNGNAELCLLGKYGRPQRITKNVKQIVMAPRGRHSAKPPEVRERIVQLMGDLPRIELFARPPYEADGWDRWGLEVK